MKKKRNLSMLSNEDWIGIEQWLSRPNTEKTHACPFNKDHSKCEMLFPGIVYGDELLDYQCPCSCLELAKVIEVVRETLAEMKAAQE